MSEPLQVEFRYGHSLPAHERLLGACMGLPEVCLGVSESCLDIVWIVLARSWTILGVSGALVRVC